MKRMILFFILALIGCANSFAQYSVRQRVRSSYVHQVGQYHRTECIHYGYIGERVYCPHVASNYVTITRVGNYVPQPQCVTRNVTYNDNRQYINYYNTSPCQSSHGNNIYDDCDDGIDISTESQPCHSQQSISCLPRENWNQLVYFKRDSWSKVRNEDSKMNLDEVARYMTKYPNVTITVSGYASKGSGTFNYNYSLAAKRVKTVKNYLANVYHIDWSRIYENVVGSKEQYFRVDNWNQCVVIKTND